MDRPDESLRKIRAGIVALASRARLGRFAPDALEVLGRRRHLALGQAVDPLDIVAAGGDAHRLAGFAAVDGVQGEHAFKRRVAVKADHEEPFGRKAQGAVLEGDRGPRGDPADEEPPLHPLALQLYRRCRRHQGQQNQTGGQGAPEERVDGFHS